MQFLVSLNNSEHWQRIVGRCQLTPLNKIEDLKALHKESKGTSAYCISTALSVADLKQLLAYEEIELLLCIDAPEFLVGQQLKQGKSIKDALECWNQQATSILKLQQQHRRQLFLAQSDGLLANPGKAPEWLANLLPAASDVFNQHSLDLYSLFASQALRQDLKIESTWQRLIACSLPLNDDPYLSFDLDALYHATIISKEQQLTAYKGEHKLILEQLFQVQEELERSETTYMQFKKQNESIQRELKEQLTGSIKKLALVTNKLTSTEADLAAIYKSRIWKCVTPVRKVVNIFKRKDSARKKLQKNVALIMSSEFFDLTWYLTRYPDVAASGINPALHYLLHGAAEGRSPGPSFDGNWYLSKNADVAESNINPLLHYILFGEKEGRAPSATSLRRQVNI